MEVEAVRTRFDMGCRGVAFGILFYLSKLAAERCNIDASVVKIPNRVDMLSHSLFSKKKHTELKQAHIFAALEFAMQLVGRQPRIEYMIPLRGEAFAKKAARLKTWSAAFTTSQN